MEIIRMEQKRFKKCGEIAFVLGILLLGLGTAVMSKASFGMSMVVSPAYVLAEAVGFITPGTMCYICQGFLVVVTFIMLRKFKVTFLFTFLAAVLFGLSVDLFTAVLAPLKASGMAVRVLLFIIGMPINSLSIAFLLHSYLPPQAPELFVKELSGIFGWDMYKTKYVYDICSCLLSIAMSLLFFREIRVIGVGTVVFSFLNSPIIGFFGRHMEKIADFSPRFTKLGRLFDVSVQ